MNGSTSILPRTKRFNNLFIAAGICLTFFFLYINFHRPSSAYTSSTSNTSHASSESKPEPSPDGEPRKPATQNKSRFAFATFLSSRPEGDIEKDPYVTATRVLAYQLLYSPVTATKQNIPFVVIVPPHVPKSIQTLLAEEGATVIPVDNLLPESWTPSPGQARWIDQFTKLRLFELTQFERIAYMDNDMLVTRCLDGIFSEAEVAALSTTGNGTEHIHADETAMPESYSIAGVTDQEGPDGERPKPITPSSRLNGGFFVFKPDTSLFAYYKSVLEHGDEGRFDAGFMEMGLLNYAHRFAGNMPWTPLTPGRWSSNWPSYSDYERGAATLHDKFWEEANNSWIDRRLVEMWWRVQGQMEGFWLKKGKKPLTP